MVMFLLFVVLQLKEFENQNRISSDAAEWTGPSSPTPSELLNNNNAVSLPPTLHFLLRAGKTLRGRAPWSLLWRWTMGPLQSPAAQDPLTQLRSDGPTPIHGCQSANPPLWCAERVDSAAAAVMPAAALLLRVGWLVGEVGFRFRPHFSDLSGWAWMFLSAVCVLRLSQSSSFLLLRDCKRPTCKCTPQSSIGGFEVIFLALQLRPWPIAQNVTLLLSALTTSLYNGSGDFQACALELPAVTLSVWFSTACLYWASHTAAWPWPMQPLHWTRLKRKKHSETCYYFSVRNVFRHRCLLISPATCRTESRTSLRPSRGSTSWSTPHGRWRRSWSGSRSPGGQTVREQLGPCGV